MKKECDRRIKLGHVLVVVDPEQALAGRVGQRGILERATELAQTSGCHLELFHACHEPSLELSLFGRREDINREKERVANAAATRMAEVALNLKKLGIDVSHEVRWDYPQSDATLRKIRDAKPDLVMKASRGPDFFLGLADNSDWELIRKSPCHLWLVKDGSAPIKTVVSAIGSALVGNEIFHSADAEIFRIGQTIAGAMDAENIPVHSYQVPRLEAYAGYAPSLAGTIRITETKADWNEVARLHGKAVSEFAGKFGIAENSIILSRGHPAEVLPEIARSKNAGLVILGARQLGRWERVFASVTAEPVLSEAPCDVLFVKESAQVEIPAEQEEIRKGVAQVNLEMAITHPEETFKSPLAVVEADQLSRDVRKRILDAWELDVQSELNEEYEGGPVRPTRAGVLREINSAKMHLGKTADGGAS